MDELAKYRDLRLGERQRQRGQMERMRPEKHRVSSTLDNPHTVLCCILAVFTAPKEGQAGLLFPEIQIH